MRIKVIIHCDFVELSIHVKISRATTKIVEIGHIISKASKRGREMVMGGRGRGRERETDQSIQKLTRKERKKKQKRWDK